MPLIERFIELLKVRYGDRLISVCLFGSIARGDFKPSSDIDLLIVIDDLPEDLGSRFTEMFKVKREVRRSSEYRKLVEEGLPRLISEVVLTPSEVAKHPPILLDLIFDGEILYDKSGFLKRELEALRRKLEGMGARRVRSRRGWYWILKPDIKFGEVVEF